MNRRLEREDLPAPPGRTASAGRRAKRSPRSPSPSLRDMAGILQMLADPTRLHILDTLMDGVQCNCNIRQTLGLPMNLISHHLRILKEAGIIRAERDTQDARWIYYQIEPEALAFLRDTLCAALDPARCKPRDTSCGPVVCCVPGSPAQELRSASPRRNAP